MQLGTYTDGRPLGYDETTGQFDVGGTPITHPDLLGYEQAGQISWASEEIRSWAHSVLAPGAGVPAVGAPAPRPKGFAAIPTWGKVLLILGILAVLGCCAAVALGGIFSSSRSDSTNPPVISDTIPEPVAPEAPAPSSDEMSEVEYAQEVMTITSDVGTALGKLGNTLSSDPEGVFTDSDVQAELDEQMAIIKNGYIRTLGLVPPERFEASHEDLLEAMRLFDESMDELAVGIDNVDADRVNRAADLMIQGSEKMTSATEKLGTP
jgi:hypothetical protein